MLNVMTRLCNYRAICVHADFVGKESLRKVKVNICGSWGPLAHFRVEPAGGPARKDNAPEDYSANSSHSAHPACSSVLSPLWTKFHLGKLYLLLRLKSTI